MDVENWSDAADQWIAWVRTENHDAFWAFQSAFENFVGTGSGTAVELGAGEGRISRVLGALGWHMTLVEPVAPLMQAAREANSAETYIEAPAHHVPLEAGCFDLVVLYNMLMDVDDLNGSVAEAARLLKPDGRMIIGIVHPILDVVHALKQGPLDPPYFVAQEIDDTCSRNGLTMRFRGWRRPLSAYVDALQASGLAVVRMAEPEPDPAHAATQRLTYGKQIPLFLWIEARQLVTRNSSP